MSNRSHNPTRPNFWPPTPPYWPPWWTSAPPCPYPTNPGWPPTPWTPPQRPPTPSRSTHAAAEDQQAHLTDYNPLEPTDIAAAFQTMTMDVPDDNWYMDSGATSHLSSDAGKFTSPCATSINLVYVGNGNRVPVLGSGHTTLPSSSRPLLLNNILHTPHILKNLISVRKFTSDNCVSVTFDSFGFSVKDYKTGKLLSRHNSTGPLYSLTSTSPTSASAFLSTSKSETWHYRLGHPGSPVFDFLVSRNFISCNKAKQSFFCHSCQLAKHKRLPFEESTSITLQPFDLLHCDLWTSPLLSKTGYKYYMVLLDDYTHFTWIFPLKFKSETFSKFQQFHKYIQTQFNKSIKCFQCDMGGEFDNTHFKSFANKTGLQFRFSCPQTSQQNGKSERMIRRLNDLMMSLLPHASLPPSYWVEALHTAAYLHNILPSKLINFHTPTTLLYHKQPSYSHLRTFGCGCYPNQNATRPHKVAPRSTLCIFLGYPPNFRGYRCLEVATGKVFLSRHVTFDESTFPFSKSYKPTQNTYTFLEPDPSPLFNFHPPSTIHTPVQPQEIYFPSLRILLCIYSIDINEKSPREFIIQHYHL
ncbi:hypothetical protein E3N88_18656 [Mikania micrantha]|uniref:Integrase catalytic domain-containing protein n=1 Tax=Mikania micrantha TaxID=192012 RepID=A0A5N6NMQ9_9ASTR|nr:hypothetical protein E3N88_18656 [Mikania micrantha]